MFEGIEKQWEADNPLLPASERNKLRVQLHRSRDEAMKAIIPALTGKFRAMFPHRYQKPEAAPAQP